MFLAYTDRSWLVGLMSVVNLIALGEYATMALPKQRSCMHAALVLGGGLLLPLWLVYGPGHLAGLLVAMVLLFCLAVLIRPLELERAALDLALCLFGLCYVCLLLGQIVLVFDQPFGRSWIFFVLFVVMSADSAAYFVGRSLGRRPLYPAVSPNKTLEGALGGLLGSIVGGLVARGWFFPELPWIACVGTAFLLSLAGQAGDLVESLLKRSFGVKDSGRLLPGHGGILDRLDSLLFAFPVAHFCAWFLF